MAILCLIFWGTTKLFSTAAVPLYSLTKDTPGFQFLLTVLWTIAILTSVKWYLSVVFIYIQSRGFFCLWLQSIVVFKGAPMDRSMSLQQTRVLSSCSPTWFSRVSHSFAAPVTSTLVHCDYHYTLLCFLGFSCMSIHLYFLAFLSKNVDLPVKSTHSTFWKNQLFTALWHLQSPQELSTTLQSLFLTI